MNELQNSPTPRRVEEDLTGITFGRLTVVKRVADILKPKNGRFEKVDCWECKCECGNTVVVKGNSLRQKKGGTKSCGCLRIEAAANTGRKNNINPIGKRFGKLIVLKRQGTYVSPGGAQAPKYLCQCDCGNKIVTTYNKLQSGYTKSCGCIRTEDLTGLRFGRLVVVQEDRTHKKTKRGECARWVCKCDCGKYTTVSSWNLKSGNTKSCGCIKSFNEQQIEKLLNDNNVQYVKEYKLEQCDFQNLRFDFAIMSGNRVIGAIEFDGEHHYRPVRYGGCSLETATKKYTGQVKRDEYKDNFCMQNKIKLLRIPYWEAKNLKPILKTFLSKLQIELMEIK